MILNPYMQIMSTRTWWTVDRTVQSDNEWHVMSIQRNEIAQRLANNKAMRMTVDAERTVTPTLPQLLLVVAFRNPHSLRTRRPLTPSEQ